MNANTRPNDDPRAALPYATLMQTHPEYDAKLWRRLGLLYAGGYAILHHAREFIDPLPGETPERFRWRMRQCSYVPYLAQIVGYIGGALFQCGLSVTPACDADDPSRDFYSSFASDCDLNGQSFADFMRARTLEALLYGRALVGLDMPRAPEVATRLDEEREGGGRAYGYAVALECMLDWETGEDGRLVWCILRERVQRRANIFGDRSVHREKFTLWEIDGAGRAAFSQYETRNIAENNPMRDEEMVSCVTPVTATSFRQIPIVQLELPHALWAGNKAGPLAEEHFRKRSDLTGSIARNLQEIPYIKRGPEIPAVHGSISETQSDPQRGADPVGLARAQGFVEIGSDDEIGFAGPSGRAFEIAARQCAELRDEIFRTLHAMSLSLANTAATVQRSGDSKREDRSATEIVLDALGDDVRRCAKAIYDCISTARGEDKVWVAHGLDKFNADDAAELVEEAPLVQNANIGSVTFRREYQKKFALAVLPKLSAETKAQISREIDQSVFPEDTMLPHLHDHEETEK